MTKRSETPVPFIVVTENERGFRRQHKVDLDPTPMGLLVDLNNLKPRLREEHGRIVDWWEV